MTFLTLCLNYFVFTPLLSLQQTNEEDEELSPEQELRDNVHAALDDDVDLEDEEPWHFRCFDDDEEQLSSDSDIEFNIPENMFSPQR